MAGHGPISSLGQLHKIISHLSDDRLKVYFITELFYSHISLPIYNPETLVAQALEHFEYFDDPDLKCRPTFYTLYMKTDLSGFQVHSLSVLHGIIQYTPLFLMPWIFVTWLYCWQLHLAIQKDSPKHYTGLHGLSGYVVTTFKPKVMHRRHRGWLGFLEIFAVKHVHSA
jgi:hypothetical protein